MEAHDGPPVCAADSRHLLTREIPYSPQNPDDYEYPFPDDGNDALFQRYRQRLAALPDVLVCGRLGDYRYYDMDQAIARALVLADELLAGHGSR